MKSEQYVSEGLKRLVLAGRIGQAADEVGESDIEFGPYVGKGRFGDGVLIFTLRTDAGIAASMRLELASEFTDRQTHLSWILPKAIYDDFKGNHAREFGDTPVYKELRLRGRIEIDPLAASKAGIATDGEATLILTGHGNRCFAESNYHHWRLELALRQGDQAVRVVGKGQARPE
ncbi:MAG: hypothetical protein AB7Q97_22835 [Gammaproteobacteria bacterium]